MEPLLDRLDTLVPASLERAYRHDPAGFCVWLDAALTQEPDSQLLQAWHARLYYGRSADSSPYKNLLLYTILISTLIWAIAKAPAYVSVDEEWFYPRFFPFLVISGLIAYFSMAGNRARNTLFFNGIALLFVMLWHFLMPHYRDSDSLIMALLHMPLVMLSILAMTFFNGQWRIMDNRLQFIRYGGELLIYTGLILLGGAVLTSLTLGLFQLIGIRLEEWYFSYVGLWGGMSAPLIATWVWDQVLQRESRLAPVIANVFSPLFLLMTVLYLLALLGGGRSPFSDREFLIIFNALLLIVWAISAFSISGRGDKPSTLMDLTNLSLVVITLIIDAVALAAILYRTFTMGITPNRVAVTGTNLLIFVHLIWIFYEYAREFRGAGSMEFIRTTIARYLPVYTLWSVIVVIFLPLVFRFA